MVALPARERTQSLVPDPLRPGQQPAAADRHRGTGSQAAYPALEISPNRSSTRRGGAGRLATESSHHDQEFEVDLNPSVWPAGASAGAGTSRTPSFPPP